MGSLLTSLTGQFAKLALLGTMLPVVFVLGLNLVLVAPLLPFGPALQTWLMRIALGEASWSLAAFTFAVFLLTGLLYNLNTPIIRLYEGYPWQRSYLGGWMAERWKRRFRQGTPLRRSLRSLGRALGRHPAVPDYGLPATRSASC